MSHEINFYDTAEESRKAFGGMVSAEAFDSACAMAQETCEKYIKHLIDIYCIPENEKEEEKKEKTLIQHKLKALLCYLEQASGIRLTNGCVSLLEHIDGFYYSQRYPKQHKKQINKLTIDKCQEAIDRCKRDVDKIIDEHEQLKYEQEHQEEINNAINNEIIEEERHKKEELLKKELVPEINNSQQKYQINAKSIKDLIWLIRYDKILSEAEQNPIVNIGDKDAIVECTKSFIKSSYINTQDQQGIYAIPMSNKCMCGEKYDELKECNEKETDTLVNNHNGILYEFKHSEATIRLYMNADFKVLEKIDTARDIWHIDFSPFSNADDGTILDMTIRDYIMSNYDICLHITMPSGEENVIIRSDSSSSHIGGMRLLLGPADIQLGPASIYFGVDVRNLRQQAYIYQYIKDGLRCNKRKTSVWLCKPEYGTVIIDSLRNPAFIQKMGKETFTPEEIKALPKNLKRELDKAIKNGIASITSNENPLVAMWPRGNMEVTNIENLNEQSMDTRSFENFIHDACVFWQKAPTFRYMQDEATNTAFQIPKFVNRTITLPSGENVMVNQKGIDHGKGDIILIKTDKESGELITAEVYNGKEFWDRFVPEKGQDLDRFKKMADIDDIRTEISEPTVDLFPESVKAESLGHEINMLLGVDDSIEHDKEIPLIYDLAGAIKGINNEHALAKEEREKEREERAKSKARGKGRKVPTKGGDERG